MLFNASMPTIFVLLTQANHAMAHEIKAAMVHDIRSLIGQAVKWGIKGRQYSTVLSVWVVQSVKHQLGKLEQIEELCSDEYSKCKKL